MYCWSSEWTFLKKVFLVHVHVLYRVVTATKTRNWLLSKFIVHCLLCFWDNKIWNGVIASKCFWKETTKEIKRYFLHFLGRGGKLGEWDLCTCNKLALFNYNKKLQYLLSVAFRIREGFDCCRRFLNHLFTSRVGHPSCLDNPSTLSALGDLLIVW